LLVAGSGLSLFRAKPPCGARAAAGQVATVPKHPGMLIDTLTFVPYSQIRIAGVATIADA